MLTVYLHIYAFVYIFCQPNIGIMIIYVLMLWLCLLCFNKSQFNQIFKITFKKTSGVSNNNWIYLYNVLSDNNSFLCNTLQFLFYRKVTMPVNRSSLEAFPLSICNKKFLVCLFVYLLLGFFLDGVSLTHLYFILAQVCSYM